MARSFGIVEEKALEADFFLGKLNASAFDLTEARYYFSAFASAARSVTFALQASLSDIDGFRAWYALHRAVMSADSTARFFIQARNVSQKLGLNPIVGGTMIHIGGEPVRSRLFFAPDGFNRDLPTSPREDVLETCTRHMTSLVELLRDCHAKFGPFIDPHLYYTRDAFLARGLGIDDADEEVTGVRGWTNAASAPEEERWRLLRGQVPAFALHGLFEKYPTQP